MTDFHEIRKLFDVWDNSFGIPEQEILECENRLGVRFPEVLRDYYLQFGNNKQMNQTQDHLVLPLKLEVDEDDFVVFYYENQAVFLAGIKFSDFAEPNPYIYLSYDQKNWEFEFEKLYNFLTAEAFHQALFGFPFNAHSNNVGDEKENYIRKNWKALEFKSKLWMTEFFQNSPDEILALMKSKNQVDVSIATISERRFNELDKKLNIDWSYNSLEDE